jgi:putative membrane protein
VTQRHGGLSRRWAIIVAVLAVFAVSSLYEIFEWSLTMTLAPGDAGAYNGEQGDMYDSQKDMACANIAALFVAALLT